MLVNTRLEPNKGQSEYDQQQEHRARNTQARRQAKLGHVPGAGSETGHGKVTPGISALVKQGSDLLCQSKI
jgi:hypothetical protein